MTFTFPLRQEQCTTHTSTVTTAFGSTTRETTTTFVQTQQQIPVQANNGVRVKTQQVQKPRVRANAGRSIIKKQQRSPFRRPNVTKQKAESPPSPKMATGSNVAPWSTVKRVFAWVEKKNKATEFENTMPPSGQNNLIKRIHFSKGLAVNGAPQNDIYRENLSLLDFYVKHLYAFPRQLKDPLLKAYHETKAWFVNAPEEGRKHQKALLEVSTFQHKMNHVVANFLEFHSNSTIHNQQDIELLLRCFQGILPSNPVLHLLKREESLAFVAIAAKTAKELGHFIFDHGGVTQDCLDWLVMGVGEPLVLNRGVRFDEITTGVLEDLRKYKLIAEANIDVLVQKLVCATNFDNFAFQKKLKFFVGWKPQVLASVGNPPVPLLQYYVGSVDNPKESVFGMLLELGDKFYPQQKGFFKEVMVVPNLAAKITGKMNIMHMIHTVQNKGNWSQ